MPDFEDLLNMKAEDAKRPPPWPVGTYTLQVAKHEFGESSLKKTPYVRFFFKCQGTEPDVDKVKFKEFKEKIDFAKKQVTSDFYFTENSVFMLKEFLEHMGVKIGGGRTFADAIPETTGPMVLGHMIQEPTQDGGGMRSKIDRWAPKV